MFDHFPTAWKYISKPKLTANAGWLQNQPQSAEYAILFGSPESASEAVAVAFEQNGLKPRITKYESTAYGNFEDGTKRFDEIIKKENLVVFGERGRFNRLGAYIVHVFLLTLFLAHFVALQSGFDATVRMIPGETTDHIQMVEFNLNRKDEFNVQMPFSLACMDIEQKLIDPKGTIDVTNTLDWRTQVRISDPEYGETIADVSMNNPLSYRGYRFFQAQTIPVGNAREIELMVTPESGGESLNLALSRNGTAELVDGTKVDFDQFLPDFT
ncbi:MAG: cytochrome c biogenesis protein ResB, partial [Acidobacteria bacterium]|nr:cytochrome c biogenesis protein ResB [Acidobacteriota bacterium]